MKALFISYNQAYNEEILEVLEANGQRGFTRWLGVDGRGSENGEPHYGSHAWPAQNDVILSIVPDDVAEKVTSELKAKDEETPELGLRVFSWNVD